MSTQADSINDFWWEFFAKVTPMFNWARVKNMPTVKSSRKK